MYIKYEKDTFKLNYFFLVNSTLIKVLILSRSNFCYFHPEIIIHIHLTVYATSNLNFHKTLNTQSTPQQITDPKINPDQHTPILHPHTSPNSHLPSVSVFSQRKWFGAPQSRSFHRKDEASLGGAGAGGR